MKSISTLKNEAKEFLRGKWGSAAVTTLLFLIVSGCTCGAPGVGYFFLAVPLEFGFSIAFLRLLNGDENLLDILSRLLLRIISIKWGPAPSVGSLSSFGLFF